MKNPKNQKVQPQNNDKPFKEYLKYSSLAFQMIALILIGVLLGKFLDNFFETNIIFTTILTLVFVGFSLYIALKDFIK